MKKVLLRTIAFCMTGSLLAISAFAQIERDTVKPGKDPSLSPTGKSSSDQACRVSKAINADVKTATGESLGKIEDLIVNPTTGKIEFAVIGTDDKLRAVPMQLLTPANMGSRAGLPSPTGTEQFSFTANIDKQKLEQATSFDKNQWPDFSASWKQQVYSHFGVRPESGVGAPGSPSGTERGLGTPDRGYPTPRPAPGQTDPSKPRPPQNP